MAIAYVLRAYLTLPLQILFLRHASGIRFADTWTAIRGPFLAAAIMGVGVWAGEKGWERIGPVLRQGYASSEAGGPIAVLDPDDHDPAGPRLAPRHPRWSRQRPG